VKIKRILEPLPYVSFNTDARSITVPRQTPRAVDKNRRTEEPVSR